jgi:hypothetical protein
MHTNKHGQPQLMRRTKSVQSQSINTRVDPELWHEMKRRALDERRALFLVVNDALKLYLRQKP